MADLNEVDKFLDELNIGNSGTGQAVGTTSDFDLNALDELLGANVAPKESAHSRIKSNSSVSRLPLENMEPVEEVALRSPTTAKDPSEEKTLKPVEPMGNTPTPTATPTPTPAHAPLPVQQPQQMQSNSALMDSSEEIAPTQPMAIPENVGQFFKKLASSTSLAVATGMSKSSSWYKSQVSPGGHTETVPETKKEVLFQSDSLEPSAEVPGGRSTELPVLKVDPFKEDSEAIMNCRQELLQESEVDMKQIYRLYLNECQKQAIVGMDKFISLLAGYVKSKQPLLILNMYGNVMEQVDCEIFARVLLMLKDIKRLSLEYLDMDSYRLELILKSLLALDKLPWLSIAFNPAISAVGLKTVSMYVSMTKSLKYLDVSGILFNYAALSLFSKAIQNSPLRIIRLDGCGLQAAWLDDFVQEILLSKVKVLSLRSNSGISTSPDGIVFIKKLFSEKSNLEKIDISLNNLKAQGVQLIFEELRKNKSLTHVFLSANNIDGRGLVYLSPVLKENTTLKALDLSGNPSLCSSSEYIDAFKLGLIGSKSLAVLNLSGCGFKVDSAITFAEVLPELKRLERLILTMNDTALNPDKAAVLNVGQNALAFGQRALKSISAAVDSTKQSGFTKLVSKSIPTGQETAMAALLAIVVSLRQNQSLTNVDIVDPKEFENIKKKWKGVETNSDGQKNPYGLLKEIQDICLRNANQIALREKSARPTSGGESVETDIRLDKVTSDADVARHNLDLLKEMLRKYITDKEAQSSSETEVMEQLWSQCKRFRSNIMKYVDLEHVAKDAKLSGK